MHFFESKTQSRIGPWNRFQFLHDGDGNRGKGGLNDFPIALELETRVKQYVMENN